MTAGGDGFTAVAGGPAPHIPVLGRRAVEQLNVRDGGIYIDGTFGAGGYSRLILETPGAQIIGIDRDPTAVAKSADLVMAADGRLTVIEGVLWLAVATADAVHILTIDGADSAASALSVSSPYSISRRLPSMSGRGKAAKRPNRPGKSCLTLAP